MMCHIVIVMFSKDHGLQVELMSQFHLLRHRKPLVVSWKMVVKNYF